MAKRIEAYTCGHEVYSNVEFRRRGSFTREIACPECATVAPRQLFAHVVASQQQAAVQRGTWCRRCGGPVSDGRDTCGEC